MEGEVVEGVVEESVVVIYALNESSQIVPAQLLFSLVYSAKLP